MRDRYWVVWANSVGRWQVTKTGNTRALKHFETKQPAIDYGVEIARNNQPSQPTIKKQNAQIEDERTYGDDPFPPAG